jgi:hypothetical protein
MPVFTRLDAEGFCTRFDAEGFARVVFLAAISIQPA